MVETFPPNQNRRNQFSIIPFHGGSALTKGITNTRYSYKLGVSPRWASQERLLTSSERRVHAHKAPTSKRKKSS